MSREVYEATPLPYEDTIWCYTDKDEPAECYPAEKVLCPEGGVLLSHRDGY